MTPDDINARFLAMKAASRQELAPDHATRLQHLTALRRLILDHRKALGAAISEDFGQRPQAETDLAEVFPSLQEIAHARRHLGRWMRRRPVAPGIWFRPGRAWVQPQPLGVVGIVVPWNYPLQLTIGPLVGALAAGNRAMVKLSEHALAFAALFAQLAPDYLPQDRVAVVTGGPETGMAFSALAFDHLLFTGSTAVGRRVMAAAAANLVPVTLELGGKSPALIAPDARLDHAVARIMAGKMLNAGQTCIAPDYVLLHRDHLDQFIAKAKGWVERHYPKLETNPDYSRIINDAQFARLTAALEAAQAGGAEILPLSTAPADPARRMMPPVLVTGAEGPLAEDEIFGPILPVVPYDDLRTAVAYITARPRPLAFYPFTESAETRDLLLASVSAGGVTVNDTLLHVAQSGLPFGGVGPSGIGAYHGQAGFERMSHLLPVFAQSRINGADWLAPPYGARFRALMRLMLR